MKLGKFEILEEIGRGGFGIVYKAKDVTLDRIVALKILLPEHLENSDLVEAFKREARHMAKISHPNVIQIHEVGEVDDQIFIAMQHCVGGSLEQKINNSGPLRLQDAIRTLYQVAHGLDAGHRIGLIHRDIKPSNILFNAAGEAAIGDFGISKAVLSTDQSGGHTFNQFSGTPFYVPPELWQANDFPTPAADIYSLACVFYEMITGEVLFAGDTFVHVLSRHMLETPVFSDQLPPQLVDVLSVALAKKPDDRFQTVSDFLSAVRQSFVGSAKPDKLTAEANSLSAEKLETSKNQNSLNPSFSQIVRRSENPAGQPSPSSPREGRPLKPPMNSGKQNRSASRASDLPPAAEFSSHSGQQKGRASVSGSSANQQPPRSEGFQDDEKRASREKAFSQNSPNSWYNGSSQNQAEAKQKQNRKQLFLLAGFALLAVAVIVGGSFLIKNNITTGNTVLTLTNLPSPTPFTTPTFTPMTAVDPGTLKFASMGSMVDSAYQSYSGGGPSNPRWSESGLETWNLVEESQEITLEPASGDVPAEAIDIQTYADVGLMLSLGAKGQVNSSVFIYNNSEVKISYTDFLEMELSEGTVFLKLESRSEIAQITLPNHQNAIAKLTGGSMLLHLNGDEVQLWCLNDDCSMEFGRESERTFAIQRRSYFPATETFDPPMDIIPNHYDELWAYNLKCNRCMDSNVFPEPTPTATSTSTPQPTDTRQPTNTPNRPSNTPTATRTPTPWNITPRTPTFTPTNTPTPVIKYSLTLIANPSNGGSVSASKPGPYDPNEVVLVTANANDGWEFTGWSGAASGTSNPVSVIMTGNLSLTANFKEKPKLWTVSVSASPAEGGSVSGGGVYEDGKSATITASPNDGYRFTGWSGTCAGSGPSCRFTVTENVSFTATFELNPVTYYTVSLNSDPIRGSTSGAGTYPVGTVVTISASPKPGWVFSYWSGGYNGTDNPHSFTLTGDVVITANFTKQ